LVFANSISRDAKEKRDRKTQTSKHFQRKYW
jgi:hypothetical protein